MYCPECGTLTLRSYTHNAMPCYRVLCANWDGISEKPMISHLAPTKGEGPCHPPPTTS